MGAWTLKSFTGEQPRITPMLLPPTAAQQASNVRLDDGALTPIRASKRITTFSSYPAAGYKTIYKFGETWLGWETVVNAVPGPVATDRLYITGDGVPKMRVGATTYNLAVSAPTAALTAALPTDGSRVYAYSNVDGSGTESEASPASAAVAWNSNRTVTISGFEDVPSGVKKQKFYRSDDGGTTWVFVKDRLATTGDFVDDIDDADTTSATLPSSSATTAPTVAPEVAFNYLEVPTSRVYVYTFVTDYGEESEPSAASEIVAWEPGQDVTLSGFEAAPTGRNITKQRIYRTQTGTQGTDLYFIAERDAANSDFTDDVAVDDFAEIIPSRAYNAPPDDLEGLISMPNGMMAAFVGKKLYFCEPFIPHAWPEAYILTTDFDIVALAAVGTSLIVMTEGNPYFAQGTDPSTMQMVKLETNYPCVNARGVVDLGYAVAYPTHEGLAAVTANGMPQLVTEPLFNREGWQRYAPATICASQLSGRYIASYNSTDADGSPIAGALIIQPGNAAFLTRSDMQAKAFFYDITAGALYFLTSAGEVRQFDPPTGVPLQVFWKSKPLLLSGEDNFACIRIDADEEANPTNAANVDAAREAASTANATLLESPLGSELNGGLVNAFAINGDSLADLPPMGVRVNVRVYADDELVATIADVNRMKRLPAGFKARKWEVEVFSDAKVDQIVLATSVTELRATGAA